MTFEKNLEKVERIIDELDRFTGSVAEAKIRFDEGNQLLDECVRMIGGKGVVEGV